METKDFVLEMQKRWNLLYKFNSRKADLLHSKILPSSPLYVKSEALFSQILLQILEAENNPQVFEFCKEKDWKETRDLLNLAHSSRPQQQIGYSNA